MQQSDHQSYCFYTVKTVPLQWEQHGIADVADNAIAAPLITALYANSVCFDEIIIGRDRTYYRNHEVLVIIWADNSTSFF